jgi:hypothetical protein
MNSCSGGSSSRIVTGRSSIASKRPSKSRCWSGRLVQRGAPAGLVRGQDHRPHLRLAVRGHEHVLGPAQPDALGAELPRPSRVGGGVGVRADAERPQLVTPAKDALEALVHARGHQRHVVERHRAGRTVDRDAVAGVQHPLADPHRARVQVDVDVRRARDRRAPHAARDERRVRGLPALRGEDAPRGVEAGHVVGLRERADQDDGLPLRRGRDRLLGGEDDRALGGAR